MKLILASNSPQRKKILEDAGYKFSVVLPKISEKTFYKNPSQIVKSLAIKKAKSVEKCRGGFVRPSTLIVGADTIVVLKRKIIGKPKNEYDARKILKKLSGSTHYVYTGIAILNTGIKNPVRWRVDYEKTQITFRKLTEMDIENACKKHLDKAGGYAIQERGDSFVKSIKGDYLNVVGFPLKKFQKMLKKLCNHE